jgi:hypothetical protein
MAQRFTTGYKYPALKDRIGVAAMSQNVTVFERKALQPHGRRQAPTSAQLRRAARAFHEEGVTAEIAAKKLGISRRTLHRWQKYPVYQAEWERLEAISQAEYEAMLNDIREQWRREREELYAARR